MCNRLKVFADRSWKRNPMKAKFVIIGLDVNQEKSVVTSKILGEQVEYLIDII